MRCPASPRHALLSESLGKPSLWVIISAPWYKYRMPRPPKHATGSGDGSPLLRPRGSECQSRRLEPSAARSPAVPTPTGICFRSSYQRARPGAFQSFGGAPRGCPHLSHSIAPAYSVGAFVTHDPGRKLSQRTPCGFCAALPRRRSGTSLNCGITVPRDLIGRIVQVRRVLCARDSGPRFRSAAPRGSLAPA